MKFKLKILVYGLCKLVPVGRSRKCDPPKKKSNIITSHDHNPETR